MKLLLRLFVTTLTLLLIPSCMHAGSKRYEIKSGIITYKVEGGGSMMGFSTKTTGTAHLYFKDWGNLELRDTTVKEISMGKTTTDHQIVKIDHDKAYIVDEKEKMIYMQDLRQLMQTKQKGKDLTTMGKEMMQEMGGKKVGTGKVLGYPCEIWEVMGSKIWLYKGIPLKSEANIMGFRHLEVATSAKFNLHVADKYFKLPDYPIKKTSEVLQERMQEVQKSHPGSAQPAMPQQPTPEQMKQMQQMLQNLGKMFEQQQ